MRKLNHFAGFALAVIMGACLLLGGVPSAKAMDTSYHATVGPYQTFAFTPSQLGIASGTALGASATKTGTAITNGGMRTLTVSFTANHPYTATLTTYLDTAETVTQEAVAVSAATNTVGVARTTVNYPFASFKVKILNTNAATGTCAVRYGFGQD